MLFKKKKNTLYLFNTLFALFSHSNFSRERTRAEGGFSCDLHWGIAFKFPCCGLEAFLVNRLGTLMILEVITIISLNMLEHFDLWVLYVLIYDKFLRSFWQILYFIDQKKGEEKTIYTFTLLFPLILVNLCLF